MSLEDLEGDDEGILHEIVVDHPVEHVDCRVVTTRGKQREPFVVSYTCQICQLVLVVYKTKEGLKT